MATFQCYEVPGDFGEMDLQSREGSPSGSVEYWWEAMMFGPSPASRPESPGDDALLISTGDDEACSIFLHVVGSTVYSVSADVTPLRLPVRGAAGAQQRGAGTRDRGADPVDGDGIADARSIDRGVVYGERLRALGHGVMLDLAARMARDREYLGAILTRTTAALRPAAIGIAAHRRVVC